MSYSVREYVKLAEKRLRQKLGLTQEQWDLVKDNLRTYCKYSDELLKQYLGRKDIDVDEEFDKLSDEEKFEIVRALVIEILKKVGKPIKKEIEDKETDDDDDSDSTSESEDVEETEEEQVACEESEK